MANPSSKIYGYLKQVGAEIKKHENERQYGDARLGDLVIEYSCSYFSIWLHEHSPQKADAYFDSTDPRVFFQAVGLFQMVEAEQQAQEVTE